MLTKIKVREDFAAAGGMSTGLQALELYNDDEVVGVEYEADAVATARAAGHTRIHADVRSPKVRDADWSGIEGYTAGPPCQGFSTAGKGEGRSTLDSFVLAAAFVADGATPEDAVAAVSNDALDERSILVLEPMLVISTYQPEWVILEQVPAVRPIWDEYAVLMHDMWGYSVCVETLNTEQYGVPQTRRRSILVARKSGVAKMPRPTHSRYHTRNPTKLDAGVLKWVSMADAINNANLNLAGDVVRSNYGTGGDPANRGVRSKDEPSFAVTSKVGRNKWSWTPEFNDQSGTYYDPDWPSKRPSTAVAGRGLVQNPGATANRFNGSTKSRNDGVKITPQEAGVLQSFPGDYPWVGGVTSQYTQIGNACPPLLITAVAQTLLDN